MLVKMPPVMYSWLHPPKYVRASILMSFGGILFGLDTGTIGPITTMPQFAAQFGALSSTTHGLVVSAILIPAALASLFCGHLSNNLGRLRATAIGALIFAAGAAIECGSVKLGMLIGGRIIKGLGQGLYLSTLVVYITEISPPQFRGILASIPQLIITVGVLVGYFTCYGTVTLASTLSFRLPYALQSFLALAFALSTLTLLPESPRWLTSRGRHEQSALAWEQLEVPSAERPQTQEATPTKTLSARDLFAVFGPTAWKRTALGVFMMGMQQLSGIDGVLYYAPLLFQSAGLTSSTSSFLASGISSLLIFLTTIPATLLCDRWSRRSNTILGGILQAAAMLVMGALYASGSVKAGEGAARWVVVVAIYIFAIAFSGSWAVVFRVYVAEIQPSATRAGATSLSLSANWIINYVVALTTPIFLAKSSSGVYFLWGGCILVTVVVCGLCMPETRGWTLEDIDRDAGEKSGSDGEDGEGVFGGDREKKRADVAKVVIRGVQPDEETSAADTTAHVSQ